MFVDVVVDGSDDVLVSIVDDSCFWLHGFKEELV